MRWLVALFDDAGLRVDQFEADLSEMNERIARFFQTHGDRSGRIEFQPIESELILVGGFLETRDTLQRTMNGMKTDLKIAEGQSKVDLLKAIDVLERALRQ